MKFLSLCLYLSGCLAALAQANNPTTPTSSSVAVSPYSITQSGPHQRIWQRVTSQTNRAGNIIYRTNAYTQLGTGLNRWSGEQWVPASDQIQLTQNGAAATNTQHHVAFNANLNTTGAINLTTPDGQRMASHVLGLAYYDSGAGDNVLFAETQDSIGLLLPSGNQVLYTNAFTNADCDVLYTHRLNGLEQDILIRQQLPSPASCGLTGSNIWLQVWTEFTAAPAPRITQQKSNNDPFLDFGIMRMGRGKAFMLGSPTNTVPVIKEWVTAEGRTFLVESVLLDSIAAKMAALPASSGSSGNSNSLPGSNSPSASRGAHSPSGAVPRALASNLPSPSHDPTQLPPPNSSPSAFRGAHSPPSAIPRALAGNFPSPSASIAPPHPNFKTLKLPPPALPKQSSAAIRLAVANPDPKGLVLDYNLVNCSLTNITFQSDTTYYVSNEVDVAGTATIEGGTVLKFDGSLDFYGPVNCLTSSYRPAVLTSANDDTVGEIISGGASGPGLTMDQGDDEYLSGLRFVGGGFYPLVINSLTSLHVQDCQFVSCTRAISPRADGCDLYLFNDLFAGDAVYCNGNGALTITAEQTTFGQGIFFDWDDGTCPTSVALTNCLFLDGPSQWESLGYIQAQLLPGGGSPGGTYSATATYETNGNPFQTVGDGNYYLATNTYQGMGTGCIDASILAELPQLTTYPPSVCPVGCVSADLVLSNAVPRDTNSSGPDVGYHYPPIDYAIGAVMLTNASLTIAPGIVVAGFDTNASGYSLAVDEGGQLIVQGSPANLCRIVDYRAVQEGPYTTWSTPAQGLLLPNWLTDNPGSGINCQFADFSILANDTAHLYGTAGNIGPINFQDCQFHGGSLTSTNPALNLINCLLERVDTTLWANDGLAPQIQNCLFFAGNLDLQFANANTLVQNNLFDQTTIADYGNTNYIGTYNGYVASCNTLTLTNSNDVFLTSSPAYQTSWLGNYYLPTNSPLINAGSAVAGQFGLYYYTTQTNQVEESNTIVDIGFHLVAVDTNGNPNSTLWFGIPDYLADTNGAGELANWEFTNYGYYGLDPNAYYLGNSGNPSNLQQYQNDPDPNVIQFTLLATNRFTTSNSAPMQLQITEGTPYYIAILVNNTNFSNPAWQTCTGTNLAVPLGTSNGNYVVWIGLRGQWANSPQAWGGTAIQEQTNSPVITLTNPIPGTVSKPVIQLQGYVSESLASFTYDLSNAATVLTNQPVAVTGQFADTNSYAITTNYFQAYDVFLTNGANTVTLHATDPAGNTTTTNYTFTLDYSGDTTAPVITVTYPLTNSLVASSNFTLLGYLDDDTANLTVSNNDGSQTVSALVERGGTFSAPNLNLPNPTNVFTLTATDAAGNTTNQQLTVIQSSLVLTVDPLTPAALSQPTITITGTISDSSQSVWVNGTPATVSGNAWSATINPPGSTSLQGLVQAGSDLSSVVGDLSVYVPMPPQVQLSSFTENYSSSSYSDCPPPYGAPFITTGESSTLITWMLNIGGYNVSQNAYGGTFGSGSSGGSTVLSTNWGTGQFWQNYSAQYDAPVYGCDSDNSIVTGYTWNSVQIQSAGQLVVGGPALSGVSQLIHLIVTAATYSATNNNYSAPGDVPVLGNQVWCKGRQFAQTCTNPYASELYLAAAAGSLQDLPLQVRDSNNNPIANVSFSNQQVTNCDLAIFQDESLNIVNQTNTTIVGQKINLQCALNGIPTNVPISYQWSIPGSHVKTYTLIYNTNTQSVMEDLGPADLSSNSLSFYWIAGATNLPITCTATVGGASNTAKTFFNINRPTGTLTSVTTTNIPPVAITTNVDIYGTNILLQYGAHSIIAGKDGISFSFSVTTPTNGAGSFALRQIADSTTLYRTLDDTNSTCETIQATNAVDELPTNFVSGETSVSGNATQSGSSINDSPAVALFVLGSYTNISCKYGSAETYFTTYLVYKPVGDGIWVTLRQLDWSWSGAATKDTNGNWTLDSGYPAPPTNPPSTNSTELPVWVTGTLAPSFDFVPCP